MSTPTPTHTAVQPLPCPFCGADGHLLIVGEWLRAKWFVSCKACDSDGPAGRDRTSAVDAWNRRASLPAPQGEQPPVEDVLGAMSKRDQTRTSAENVQDVLRALAALGASQDSRASSVAPGGQPLAQPNSQDGDSVLPPVEPPGATLSPCAASQWISASERMPEPDSGEVLVWLTGGRCAFDEWHMHREDPIGMSTTYTMEMGLMWRDYDFEEVSHWMPLPEPPQVDRGESSSERGAA